MGKWLGDEVSTEAMLGRSGDSLGRRVYLPACYMLAAVTLVGFLYWVWARHTNKLEPASRQVSSESFDGLLSGEVSLQPQAPSIQPAEVVKAEVVVLPPVTLKYIAAKAQVGSPCRESELEIVCGDTQASERAMALMEEARHIEETLTVEISSLECARTLYQQALDSTHLDDQAETRCLLRLTDLANRIVLDPKITCKAPPSVFHKVEPGEGVEKISRQYHVNQGQIKKLNKLNDKMTIRYGQVLKILPGDVLFTVNRTRLTGTLYIDGVFIRRYPVGIGPGKSTPAGTFTIDKKVSNPDWYYEGKRFPFGNRENILGTRWMGFSEVDNSGLGTGLGVHGTAFPETVPGRESKGCVRLHNNDVEELYDLMPQGGKVKIID